MPRKPKTKRRMPAAQHPDDATKPSAIAGLESYLRRKRLLVMAGVVVLSVLLRVGYFFQLNAGPCIWQHRWDQCDMNFFDSWARQIAAGDWLCENVDPPVHDWHRLIANDYYRHHPDQLPQIEQAAGKGQGIEAAQVLWNRWAGGKRYYQGPLYPYLIALTYRLWPDARCVFVWQMAAGVLINVLVYLLARRLFGDVVGVLAGLMACLYSPLLHTELILLRETLVVLAALAMVYLADVATDRKKFIWWLLAGLVMGLSLLHKAHFGLFAVGAAALLVIGYRRQRKVLARSAAGLAVGLAIGIAPLIVRNMIVGVSPLSTASSAAPAFALWNAYEPDTGARDWRVSAATQIMAQTQGRGSVFLPSLRTHPSAASYLKLLAEKFALAWHWYEFPDSANLYYYRLHSSVLRSTPLTFFALAPLAMVGLVLAVRHASRCRHLYLQVFTNLTVLVFFSPNGRLRLPMVAALIPFAAFNVVCLARWIADGRKLRAGAAVLAAALLWLWTGQPLPDTQPTIRTADYLVPYQVHYAPLIAQAAQAGQWQQAADIITESLEYEPEAVRRLANSQPAVTPDERKLGNYYWKLHEYLAHVLLEAGHLKRAAYQRRRAAEIRAAIGQTASSERQ